MLGGNLGSLLYGDVSMMTFLAWSTAQLVENQALDCKVTGSNLEQDTSSSLLNTGSTKENVPT